MVLALLAPEVMIMWAFKQWRGAVMIKEIVNKARPNMCICMWCSCAIELVFDNRPDDSAGVDSEARVLPSDGWIQDGMFKEREGGFTKEG